MQIVHLLHLGFCTQFLNSLVKGRLDVVAHTVLQGTPILAVNLSDSSAFHRRYFDQFGALDASGDGLPVSEIHRQERGSAMASLASLGVQ